MIVWWIAILVAGIATAAYASRRAVDHALDIADQLGLSKGLVGVTIVAIGTDLPEIANSISASITGHGDLVVGDATGSTLAQVTLILAILAATSRAMRNRGDDQGSIVMPVGLMTVAATILIALLIADGTLSRADGAALVALWAISMVFLGRWQRPSRLVSSTRRSPGGRSFLALAAWLTVVAVAATAVVRAFVTITDAIGVPELVAGTVVLALGTSLPELVVDWAAIRRGAAALAVGDLFGSSLVDATLSIGIGPMFRSTPVSDQAVGSVLVVAAGVLAATLIWQFRRPGAIAPALHLFFVYLSCTAAIILITA